MPYSLPREAGYSPCVQALTQITLWRKSKSRGRSIRDWRTARTENHFLTFFSPAVSGSVLKSLSSHVPFPHVNPLLSTTEWCLHSPPQTPLPSPLYKPTYRKDANDGMKSPSKSPSTPNASHSPLGNYNSMGHPWSTPSLMKMQLHTLSPAIQEKAQEFPLWIQSKTGFCFNTNHFYFSVKRQASHPLWQKAVAQLGVTTAGRYIPRVVGAW